MWRKATAARLQGSTYKDIVVCEAETAEESTAARPQHPIVSL
jgi:hypothetical protein